MRWRDRRQSNNIEDRRTLGPGRGMAVAGGGLGLLLVVVLGLMTGVDPLALLEDVAGSGAVSAGGTGTLSAEDKEAYRRCTATRRSWPRPRTSGRASSRRRPAGLRGAAARAVPRRVESACGLASARWAPSTARATARSTSTSRSSTSSTASFGAPATSPRPT